jgi:membrane-bound serine protease (ClpP class)
MPLLMDPNLLFILFIVSVVGMYLEFSHPGAIVPGVVGAAALVFFFIGAVAFGPNWLGLMLMLLAGALLVLDVHRPSHGVLTVGGILSLVVGSIVFFNSHAGAGQLQPWVVAIMVAALSGVALLVLRAARRVRGLPVTTGVEALIGSEGIALSLLAPGGWVRVRGERWAATTMPGDHPIEPGQPVRVIEVSGLSLKVQPAEDS